MSHLITYIDIDAFAVAVERKLDPDLCGRPVIISTQAAERGLVACASYDARARGVRTAMPIPAARRRVDGAAFLPSNQVEYERASRALFKFLHNQAPVVEVDKLDGFFLDLTGCERWMKIHPMKWVQKLVDRLKDELHLPASFGIGTNKLLAKIAARVAKPGRAIYVVAGDEEKFLAPVSVGLLPGVGRATRQELREFGITRIGQLVHLGDEALQRIYGSTGHALWERARGIFYEPVTATPLAETLQYDHIFSGDTSRMADIETGAAMLAQRLEWRLRNCSARCCTARVELIYADGHQSARRLRVDVASDDSSALIDAVRRAASQTFRRRVRVRSLHLTAALHPEEEMQFDFFQEERQRRTSRLYQAIDQVRLRHGFDSLIIAGGLGTPAKIKHAEQGTLWK